MRPSKSRSRSKSNRNRSVGNIINRVFDSSGPEGKVRGTPQQIIDKYNQLARDAQLSNDRVATENFQQHAEHYTRLLSEAQREMDARREQQEQQNRDRQREREEARAAQQQAEAATAPASAPQPAGDPAGVVDLGPDASESGLVDTPETTRSAPAEAEAAAPKPRPRRPRRPKPPADDTASSEHAAPSTSAGPSEAAE